VLVDWVSTPSPSFACPRANLGGGVEGGVACGQALGRAMTQQAAARPVHLFLWCRRKSHNLNFLPTFPS
jgi:hypothetical protein